jgi:hypothetical protein
MRLFSALALATLTVSATSLFVGCSSDEPAPASEPVAAETGPEDDLTSTATKSCGAAYTPALRKYELAVQASKKLAKDGMCSEAVHDKDASYSTIVTREDIASLMLTSIEECGAFRDVYLKSKYAAPVRDALSASLLARVAAGTLDPASFRGLGQALVGTTLYGPKPGVALLFWVDFGQNGQATFHRYDWELEKEVTSPATYRVDETKGAKVIITSEGTDTVYGVSYEKNDSYRDILLTPPDGGSVISTSSSPCDA